LGIGTSRLVSYANEKGGWGAFFGLIKADAAVGATTISLVGSGGKNFGTATVAVGMTVFFKKKGKRETRDITAVTIDGSGDATITIAATTYAHAKDEEVCVGYRSNKATLLDAFSSNRNNNNWSSNPFTGGRSKNSGRKGGRIEMDGNLDFMLRPQINAGLMVKAVGQETGIVGTAPATRTINDTLTLAIAAGDTTFKSAGAFLLGDYVEVGTGATAEVRKVTIVGTPTNGFTVDAAFQYAHANASAIKRVVAPFIRTVPAALSKLDSVAFEDFVPMDDEDSADGLAKHSYYIPGAVFKSLKLESQSEQGINVTLEYDAQDKIVIDKSTPLPVPSEDEYSFDEEAVLFDGIRNYLCTEISIESGNDLQSRYAKNGSRRKAKSAAGQHEVTGSLKFMENSATQQDFWDKMEANTPVQLSWRVTDRETGYYTEYRLPKIIFEEVNDSDFGPADLIDVEVPFVAINDTGGTNTQLILVLANGDHLPY
jgi:hypothetical protein